MKNALIIGNLQDESIVSELRIKNVKYKVKLLSSYPSNWEKIIKMVSDDFDFVIWKLTETALMKSCLEDYSVLFYELLDSISSKKHMILIYEDNLQFQYSYIKQRNIEKLGLTHISNIKDLIDEKIKYIRDNGFNIFTYQYSEHVHKLVQNFIENEVNGLIMKFYVPKERMLSKELSKITELFESYINSLYDINIKVSKLNTKGGILIEFYSDDDKNEIIRKEWNEFPTTMEVFATDYGKTVKIISSSSIQQDKKDELIRYLSVESKRLLLDIKYEMNRKKLELSYLVENKLLEYEVDDYSEIESFNLVQGLKNEKLLQLGHDNIENVNYTVINNIQGNVINNAKDQQLIDLIYKLSGVEERSELISCVNEVNDESIRRDNKLMSFGKIKNFLIKHSDSIGDIGFKLLMNYLESKA